MKPKNSRNLIILVHPGEVTNWLWEDNFPFMPFESLFLARYLEEHGYDVMIVDQRVDGEWKQRVRGVVDQILWVGVTAISGPQVTDALKAAADIREIDADLPIVWGGWHPSFFPEKTINHPLADFVVTGIGELKVVQLSEFIAGGMKGELDVPGLLKKGVVKPVVPVKEKFTDLVEIPAYHLIDPDKYRSKNNMAGLITARGCPFRCSFCTIAQIAYINRPIESVLNEIRHLIGDLGFEYLNFADGHFFAQRARVLQIIDRMHEEGHDFKWNAGARPETLGKFRPHELERIMNSGLQQIMIGAESGSDVMLERIVKDAKPEDIVETARITGEYGIRLSLSFMSGLPYETTEDLRKTIDVVEKVVTLNPQAKVINPIYQPIPGAPSYDQMLELGWTPPETLEAWGESISWNQQIEDIECFPWMKPAEFDEYVEVFQNSIFGKVRTMHFTGQERSADVSVSGTSGELGVSVAEAAKNEGTAASD
ncbi:MAG: B12-binding domain-containing radical SAM protein [Rhodospirillaceae bacterium]|nr:B12-binding domain-containing radical SAM protein [Rhodospirillaceae bacterium]